MLNQNHQKNRRAAAILIAIVLILTGLGIYAHFKQKAFNNADTPADIETQTPHQTELPTPKTLSPFKLIDDAGNAFTQENLKGRWSMIFFGFTRCGEVCPVTLAELNKMYTLLQKDLPPKQLPQIVFITVDPERDNLEALRNYVKSFNSNFIGATADADNLNIFAKEMGIYFKKTATKDPKNYGINHSAQIFIFNPNGDWVAFSSYPSQGTQLAEYYETIIKNR